ncbi:MAG: hypothetical protein ACK4WH_14680, partial [Phycisphaerales bacterium]
MNTAVPLDTVQAFANCLIAAQSRAIEKLAALLESADDPREVRRIATALLRARPPRTDAPRVRPIADEPDEPDDDIAPPHPPIHPVYSPLTRAELARLRRRFPDAPPDRFLTHRSPIYWRAPLGGGGGGGGGPGGRRGG